ncbi:hypothetical protein KVV02_002021 [Mortierella alpina]|uniref:Uncharacterized protein n=1 Tax=Mortierella alpina TaxID=64518 RepID=A0A9P8AA86_MORAP|nr:hypothetical protein KVV02_002021 [Mortierella alpina]
MGDKHEFPALSLEGKAVALHEKDHALSFSESLSEDYTDFQEQENSPIEAVRLAVPITDDPSLPVVTFRFWLISFFFTALGATVQQYYFFRSSSGTYSIFFVNLVSFTLGKAMARTLSERKFTVLGQTLSLNPGPFNIKEHALIGIAVSTGAGSAYAIDILSATDLFLGYRINALGSILLIITTQCCGYGMAGLLRRYLVYPAEMVWWSNLVQVVFYNTMHNTQDFQSIRLVRGWSRMKFFWVVTVIVFLYQFIPQWLAPILVYFDWLCWIRPFDMNFWAFFSSISGGGILSLSFDWTSIGGATMYLPLSAQLCSFAGVIVNYWIILPIMWMNNYMGVKTIGKPLTTKLFYEETGKPFNIKPFLNEDYSREALDGTKPDANGLWTGQRVQTFWGSGLIYGALGPARMFAFDGKYWFVYYGFLIGFLGPIVLWALSKKFPQYQWSKLNVAIFAGGLHNFPNGYAMGILVSLITALVFQWFLFRYHKGWWTKYTFILSAALDTGAAFTGLIIFLFLGGGLSPKLSVNVPSWWGNYYTPEGDNGPYLAVDRCGAANNAWTSGAEL